jgi:hypothetical protein
MSSTALSVLSNHNCIKLHFPVRRWLGNLNYRRSNRPQLHPLLMSVHRVLVVRLVSVITDIPCSAFSDPFNHRMYREASFGSAASPSGTRASHTGAIFNSRCRYSMTHMGARLDHRSVRSRILYGIRIQRSRISHVKSDESRARVILERLSAQG